MIMPRNEIHEIIVNAMERLDMKQVELADELKVSKQQLNKWISGENIPNAKTFLKICKVLNTDVNSIIGTTKNHLDKDELKILELYHSMNADTKQRCVEVLQILYNVEKRSIK